VPEVIGAPRCIVTGAASGIGQAIAARFCDDGCTVVGLDVSDAAVTAERCGANFSALICDVADVAAVRAAFAHIDSLFGAPPDVLVNCAATFSQRHFLDEDPATFDRLYAVNVRGYMVCGQEAARRMRSAGRGSIVNIGSTAAEQGWRDESLYCATKGAVVMLTRGMAVDLAPYGITVNCVGPGSIDTPGVADVMHGSEIKQRDLARTPQGRWGRPSEIATAVRFLALDAEFTTGQVLYVDGGFLATGLGWFGSATAPGES
jgi:NAD(P)-dependent dehydrogenase (short-subunit alcohol dehydrogenase family)